jgi:hypothetical protein
VKLVEHTVNDVQEFLEIIHPRIFPVIFVSPSRYKLECVTGNAVKYVFLKEFLIKKYMKINFFRFYFLFLILTYQDHKKI